MKNIKNIENIENIDNIDNKEESMSLFQKFSCKCGDCRNSCCIGWNVTVSREEYYRLINLDIDEKTKNKICLDDLEKVKEIKSKLINAFISVDHPSKERFAMIKKNYFGDCVFHGEDGLCEIHKYFGEKSIASVCREYPRCETLNKGKSVSNSCEKVLELLFDDNNCVLYHEDENTLSIMTYIDIMQNRTKTIIERIRDLRVISNHDSPAITIYKIGQKEDIKYDELSKVYLEFLKYYQTPFINNLYEKIKTSNVSFEKMKKEFYKKFLDFDVKLEKMVVNHMHFKDFKINDGNILGDKNYLSLLSTIYFVLFTTICLSDEISNQIDLIDFLAKLFRVLGHSNFDVAFGLYLLNEVKDENKIFSLVNILLP